MSIPIEKNQIAKTTDQWVAQNPVLASDVIGIEVMNNGYNRYKRGNGRDAWKNLPYLDKKPPMQAHTHSAGQISGLPTSLPANGGNADTVDNKHASDFAPIIHSNNAAIHVTATDKSNWNGKAAGSHTHSAGQITGLPTSLPANGGNADTVDNKHASDFALASPTLISGWSYGGNVSPQTTDVPTALYRFGNFVYISALLNFSYQLSPYSRILALPTSIRPGGLRTGHLQSYLSTVSYSLIVHTNGNIYCDTAIPSGGWVISFGYFL